MPERRRRSRLGPPPVRLLQNITSLIKQIGSTETLSRCSRAAPKRINADPEKYNRGAGAGMALEDAYIMSSLLGAAQKSSDIESAFRAFDAVRRPRTQKLVSTSREAGELYALEAEGVGDDLHKLRERLLPRYDWIWDANLEEELAEAMSIMGGEGVMRVVSV